MQKIVEKCLNKETLDALNLSNDAALLKGTEVKKYYEQPAGAEHYRLLSQLSNSYDNILILDIGTREAGSALALSSNAKNRVISFDISADTEQYRVTKENIEYRIENILESPDGEKLLQEAKIILLDTLHDGTFETQFFERLKRVGFNGLLIADDIRAYKELVAWFSAIELPKLDVTPYGHWSGTGIVFFNPDEAEIKIHEKMQVHILGLPNYRLGWTTAANNPFNTKIIYMVRMLKKLGHIPICYCVEGSVVDDCEIVPTVSSKTFNRIYGQRDKNALDGLGESTGPAWDEFARSTVIEIRKRVKNPMREIVLNFMGDGMQHITDAVSDLVIALEPGIGHGGPTTGYKAYESYAWQHFMYGRQAKENNFFPNMYERVIPAYFDVNDYVFSEKKEDYFLYIGRLTWGKGVSVAIEASHALGKKLIVIGGGSISDVSGNLKCGTDHVEHLGVLSLKHKMRYLSKAKALFAFSLYVEPCGHAPIEAMLCGTPVITSDVGAFSETVKHGVSGYRCRLFNDVYWAAKKVEQLDPYKIRNWAVGNFGLDAIAPLYQEFLDDVIGYSNKDTDWYTVDKINPKMLEHVGRYLAYGK